MWTAVKGYENDYEITVEGQIRRKSNKRTVSSFIGTSGYLQCQLWCKGKSRTRALHRILAETFLHNPENYPHVNHKDEDRLNNALPNLEWCTEQYNQWYSKAKILYLARGAEGILVKGIEEASNLTGLSRASIDRMIKNPSKTVKSWAILQ